MTFSNPLLFLPPELAHCLALWAVKHRLIGKDKRRTHLQKDLLGLTFPSSVGLSAGADKNCSALAGWSKVGFGFIEAGTVTLKPRSGNPTPRVWRQKELHSVVNWMGLPNLGLEVFIRNLKDYRARFADDDLLIGVSVASPDGVLDEFATLSETCAPYADYFTLNASCPNVAHGDDHGDALQAMVDQIACVVKHAGGKPVLLKLAPTIDFKTMSKTLKAAQKAGAQGFVLTNTVPPTGRGMLGKGANFTWPQKDGHDVGGYSGPALKVIMIDMVKHARSILGADVPLIGVGGIQSATDARAVLEAGADLIQLYTGFIYQGPKLIEEINQSL